MVIVNYITLISKLLRIITNCEYIIGNLIDMYYYLIISTIL